MSTLKLTVAFAGLGAMGYGMALHLLRSGFSVVGYDVYGPAMDRFAAEGGASAKTPREAVDGAIFFICMVANSVQATPLLFDDDIGAVQGLPLKATILMCSTVAPAYIDEIRKRLDEIRPDVGLIDSPVSGGAGRAADGTLSIFSSGQKTHLDHAKSILECMSSKLYQIPGGLGGGSKAKLVHQIFAGVNIAMASETMALAALAGFNTAEIFNELKMSDGNSWMFSNRVPYMLDPQHSPYSAISIIAKDVAIISSTSRGYAFPLPLLSTAEQLYQVGISSGWGSEDDCVMVRLYLPRKPDLVHKLGRGSSGATASPISVQDLQVLMVGVHLAVTSEAMSFCEYLGIDADLMFDIVSNAAGASNVFVSTFAALRAGAWSLKTLKDIEQIRQRLSKTVDKASQLRCPLFLSSAALQELHRQLR